MNDLQICNENGELINMQIDACNTAVDFFETISKKGARDFVTQMGKLNLKAKEIQLKEDALQQQYSIAELKENNKYRLATLNLRNTEIEAQNRVDLAKINAVSEYKKAEFGYKTETEIANFDSLTKLGIAKSKVEIAEIESNTQIQKAKIKALSEYKQAELSTQREIRLEELKNEQLKITEQSKCLQQLIANVKDAYDRKYDFYEAQLKFCMEYFYPQIQSIDQRILILTEQYNQNFENQEAHMLVHKQLKRLERARRDINDKVESIVSNLTNASKIAKLEFDGSVNGFLK